MTELISATVEARLRAYEFAASMCGDRDVLKLTAAEAMQVLFPLIDAWDRASARAEYWQEQHGLAADSAARSFRATHELQAENDRLQRIAHAAGVFAELEAERKLADDLAIDLQLALQYTDEVEAEDSLAAWRVARSSTPTPTDTEQP